MSTINFAGKVKTYLKAAGYSQKILANELGMNSSVLTHKLNGTGRFILTHPEIRDIVRTLAKLEAITRKPEAQELLELANCPGFSSEEWKNSPLKNLEEAGPGILRAGIELDQSGHHLTDLPSISLNPQQNNLPVQITSFVGREREIEHIKTLLTTTHLLTLAGTGGVGKTRLALQVGTELLNNFKGGIWFVELASLTEPSLVAQKIAQVLKIRTDQTRSLNLALVDYFKNKQSLLIMDNCEHLIDACASLIMELLRNCPFLRILTTSREIFEVTGEVTYQVTSLSLPDLKNNIEKSEITLDLITDFEAVRLFMERAVAVQPGFIINNELAPLVAQICFRLDGIPLAIELAAARTNYLGLHKIAQLLDDRFHLLTGGSRTALPRQKTLKAAIDWGYNLLEQKEQLLLRRLAIFAGGWSLESAEAVCSGEGLETFEILDCLHQLVNKSFITVEEQGNERRFRFLETILEYLLAELRNSGEFERMQTIYIGYFLNLAEAGELKLDGAEQELWFNLLLGETDNFRACFSSAISRGDGTYALQLGGALGNFWVLKNFFTEGRKWLDAALVHRENQPLPIVEKALHWAGMLAHIQGDSTKAITLHQQALVLGREIKDIKKIAMSLNALGIVEMTRGHYAAARLHLVEAIEIERSLGDKQKIAYVLVNLGNNSMFEGKFQAAKEAFVETLEIHRETNNIWGQGYCFMLLGLLAIYQNNLDLALNLLQEGLTFNEKIGDSNIANYFADNLGIANLLKGDFSKAGFYFKSALETRNELNDKWGFGFSFENFASLAAAQEDAFRAVRLFGAAEKVFEEAELHLPPPDVAIYKSFIDFVRGQLDDESFLSGWNEGRTMSLEQAINFALSIN